MIFAERRKLLKFAAIIPLATFMSPISALSRCGFDEVIQEIAQSEKLFIQLGKDLQATALQQNFADLRQQLMFETGCLDSSDKAVIQESILARIKDDFRNNRVANHQGWILSKTELNICQLAFLS
jgi:hypothetical protein